MSNVILLYQKQTTMAKRIYEVNGIYPKTDEFGDVYGGDYSPHSYTTTNKTTAINKAVVII